MPEITMPIALGTIAAGFLTLCIFSFLYKDNPFYKFAEHLYVGVSAGYIMAMDFQNVLVPNLFGNLGKAWQGLAGQHIFMLKEWSYILPGILGIMLLLRLFGGISWISRWPLAFLVGISAGMNIVYTLQAQVLQQLRATLLPLWISPNLVAQNLAQGKPSPVLSNMSGPLEQSIFNIILIAGVCCGLIYFYFSKEHRGAVFGTVSRVGIAILMVTFGAGFGYTVMARISLLIGRVLFFRDEFWPALLHLFRISG